MWLPGRRPPGATQGHLGLRSRALESLRQTGTPDGTHVTARHTEASGHKVTLATGAWWVPAAPCSVPSA